jgi:phage terminase small subunit
MPAKKPLSLNQRHSTKEELQERESAESAMTPVTQLNSKPPALLQKRPYAIATWKRLIKLYDEVAGTILTAFDEDLLVKYCLAEEEMQELYTMRSEIKAMWTIHAKWLNNLKPKADNLKDYFKALEQANALLQRFQGMDARMDGKRKLFHSLAQSLYLTPRSRAGVAPTEKPKENPDGFGKEFD